MSKVGFIGLGHLGLPVALAIEDKGHTVYGYDISPDIPSYFRSKQVPYKEKYVNDLLKTSKVKLTTMEDIADECDLIFIAIQTPHSPEYEGVTRIPKTRADFDYNYLIRAVRQLVYASKGKELVISIISTVLPGTINREIKPALPDNVHLIYNPFFIAMGTVIDDFLNPEFVLLGRDSDKAEEVVTKFYKTIHDKPLFLTDINTAEGIKVFYNTFITAKTLLANAWLQSAHKAGMNCDDITKAISMANDRLISPKYLRGGGADSGGCHPRDLIALSWFGEQIDLFPNWFEMMAQAREQQTDWTAKEVLDIHTRTGLPVVIMGKAFKPETNLTVGSGATLLANLLKEKGVEPTHYDPIVEPDSKAPDFKAIYFIATEHKVFDGWNYPKGSIVIDQWRSITPPPGCLYIPLGNPNAIQDNRAK